MKDYMVLLLPDDILITVSELVDLIDTPDGRTYQRGPTYGGVTLYALIDEHAS